MKRGDSSSPKLDVLAVDVDLLVNALAGIAGGTAVLVQAVDMAVASFQEQLQATASSSIIGE
jgi:hypothetical protein